MAYSWYKEIHLRTLDRLSNVYIEKSKTFQISGLFGWLENAYPEINSKISATENIMNSLYNRNDPASMKKFKEQLKRWEEGVNFSINRYVEDHINKN